MSGGYARSPTLRPVDGRAHPHVAVLLSERLRSIGSGVDVEELGGWLEARMPAVTVHVLTDPRRQLREMASILTDCGAQRLVLGLGPGEYSAGEVQAQAQKAGLDPLGIVAIDVGSQAAVWEPAPLATERARLLLAGGIARARAFPGSRPENLKASLSVSVSRRALFTLSAHEYRAVPSVSPDRCAANRGCYLCVNACRVGALRLVEGHVEVSKTRCQGCGRCMSICPRDAIQYPGNSISELGAEITTLLDPSLSELGPRGILFVCRGSLRGLESMAQDGRRYPAGWLPVVVPCTGMLSPALFLQCLAAGAVSVGVVPCGGLCTFGQDSIVEERVAFCQELLELMSAPPGLVRVCPVADGASLDWPLPSVSRGDTDSSFPRLVGGLSRDPGVSAGAMLYLAHAYGAPEDLTLMLPQSPFGVVDLDAAGCTACGACVAACPTGALSMEDEGDSTCISFDSALCCACGLCVPRCPEGDRGVLRLTRQVDLRRLRSGRATLFRSQRLTCRACGAPITAAAMVSRLAEMLGDQYTSLAATITRYCSHCRGTPAVLRGTKSEQ